MQFKGLNRLAIPLILASLLAVSLWFASPPFGGGGHRFVYGQGYGGGIGGGGGAPAAPGVTNLTIYTNDEGTFNIPAVAPSDDGKVTLSIAKGVKAKTKDGTPLKYVGIAKMADPPAPPADTTVIGLIYDITPAGATFDPAVTLTFSYDVTKLPAGVNEKKLVVAWYDSAVGKWVELGGTVDTTNHTITVQITRLTPFAVIAHTRPASFSIGSLSVSPTEVTVGESVSVSANVSNSGDLSGSYKVTLKVDSATVGSTDVTVAGGEVQTVRLSAVLADAGTHKVDLNGLTAQVAARPVPVPAAFKVANLVINPVPADIGQPVTVSIVVTNTGTVAGTHRVTFKIDGVVQAYKDVSLEGSASQTVSFTATKAAAGTYTVDVDGVTGSLTVKPAVVPPARGVNWWWWLVGGVVAVIVAIAVVLVLIRRQQTE